MLLLQELGTSGPELGVTELSTRLELHKSTVSRLLGTLEAGGFVAQNPHTARYRLGLQLATLAGQALSQLGLRDAARPLLEDLAVRSGETVTLSVLDGDEAVNIDQVPGPQPVKHLGWIGRRLPLHATAAGKPLLAALPPDRFEAWRQRPFETFTGRGARTLAEVEAELARVRSQGYAVAAEEYEAGLSAVGAPVRDYRGQVVASITVSGPSFRLPPRRLRDVAKLVQSTAERISFELGYWPGRTTARRDRTQTDTTPAVE